MLLLLTYLLFFYFLLLIIQKTFANIGIFFTFAIYLKELTLKTNNKIKICLLIFVVVIVVSACSTTKDKWINRQYNSVVAHYNAWWNGNEALKEAVKTLDKSHKDDFTKILPIYKLGSKENVASIKSNTDRAIEKGSKVIQKYSMKFSGVEKNPQIDDAYLLMGKACFYSQDYVAALATFNLLIAQYKDRKESYEPMIWAALTNSKMGNHSECDILLDQVKSKIDEGAAPRNLSNFMNLVYAENALSQGKNALAMEYFNKRKFTLFDKSLNTRLMFIKGQIYQKADEFDQATKLYKKVARRAGDYEMEFASRLNIAMCYDPKKNSSKPIISRLEKMLEDKKNVEYKDQVYYALGEVYFRDKNVDKACLQWEESSAASTTNKIQKINSCLRAADTYFELLEKYERAQMYYDTALDVMPKDYPSYKTIESRQKVLTNLVTNLRCVERWDSLLAMSVMSEADLNAKIDSWIAEYKRIQKEKEEAAKKAQALAASMAGMTNYSQFNNRNSWYFYNSSTVQVGQLEFRRIWGERKLEDNWRISHKESEFEFDEMTELDENGNPIDSTSSGKGGGKVASKDPASREYYTKDIPFSQGAKDTANAEIAEALLAAGYIYYQGLNNYGKAIETFLELHRRYPQHKNILPSSYHLYRLYDKIGQYPNSNFYKNKILQEYPDSEFAMMINNPDYWAELAKINENAEKMYADVYNTYLKDRYEETIEKSKIVIDSLKIGPYIPKLLYVQALAKGRIYGIDTLAMDLNLILHNYTESEIAPMIESQLKHLAAAYPDGKIDLTYTPKAKEEQTEEGNKESSSEKQKESKDDKVNKDDILDAETLVFRYRDMKHYYVLLFDEDKIDAIELEKNINAYNDSLFASNNLNTMAMLFTMTKQMISVRQFENKEKAMEYYQAMNSENSPLVKYDAKNFQHFVISTQNYPTFYNRQNIEAYLKFFKLMYLKN
jgi:tetratricopeptide (TPR) repeat protein